MITGMHCNSCEKIINLTLEELPGIKNVKTSYQEGECRVDSDQSLNAQAVIKAIADLGYQAKVKDTQPLSS